MGAKVDLDRSVVREPPSSDTFGSKRYPAALAMAAAAAIFSSLYSKPIPLMHPRTANGASADASAGSDDSSIESLVAGIPNVSISYYDIASTDAGAIRSEMTSKGPVIRGKHFDGQTRWNYR